MPPFIGRPNYTSDQLSLVMTIRLTASFWFDQKNLLHDWPGWQVEHGHLWPLTIEFKKDHLFGEVHIFLKVFTECKMFTRWKTSWIEIIFMDFGEKTLKIWKGSSILKRVHQFWNAKFIYFDNALILKKFINFEKKVHRFWKKNHQFFWVNELKNRS